MRMRGAAVLAFILSAGMALAVGAQTPAADETVAREVLGVRAKLRAAIAAGDRQALEERYAANYSHIHENGRADLKQERIDNLLRPGAVAIETMAEEEVAVQPFGPTTAVVTGISPIADPASGRTVRFQWLALYVKLDGASR